MATDPNEFVKQNKKFNKLTADMGWYQPGGAAKKPKKEGLWKRVKRLFKRRSPKKKKQTVRTDYVDRRLKSAGLTEKEIKSLKGE
ncbi:MAG: hypothetical protein M0Q27_03285 [Candidatus Colwellbacteria bacterium]|nr:hypothetical protein [Candidatus Colwellbacteria bacterium]